MHTYIYYACEHTSVCFVCVLIFIRILYNTLVMLQLKFRIVLFNMAKVIIGG